MLLSNESESFLQANLEPITLNAVEPHAKPQLVLRAASWPTGHPRIRLATEHLLSFVWHSGIISGADAS